MSNSLNIKVIIAFIDPELDGEEREEQAKNFMAELKEMDELEAVERVPDPNPPKRNKALGGFLLGLLAAEVSLDNAKKLIKFLGDRLSGKPIELTVEANGKKLSVKAHSREELEAAISLANDFIEA